MSIEYGFKGFSPFTALISFYWDGTWIMRKEGRNMIAVALIGGAFSFFMRWLQNTAIFDPETGLAQRNSAISWILVLLCIVVALVQLVLTSRVQNKSSAPQTENLFYTDHKLLRYIYILLAGLTALAGLLLLIGALRSERGSDVLRLILALLALGTGASLLVLVCKKTLDNSARCLCSAVPVLFNCFWLIVCYKDNAVDPVIWRFCMQILAICAAILAWYYLAGYAFGSPKKCHTLFTCQLAGYLSILVLSDSFRRSEKLLLIAPGLLLLLVAARLANEDLPTPAPEAELPQDVEAEPLPEITFEDAPDAESKFDSEPESKSESE